MQEALTNARKHAPGQTVDIRLAGARGRGLTLDVRNALPDRPVRSLPGGGTGIAGLRERAALIGGRLTHTRTPDTHRLQAELPWPA